jgi:hypothetical protein
MNLFKSLLFLHGHFVRLEDIEPADAASPAAPDLPAPLQFPGGRPMHAGHKLDVEEPFDPLPTPSQRKLANFR